MKRLFAVFALVFCAQLSQAQTTINAGRAIEVQIKGVPTEEMSRVNGTYTVSESGVVRMPLLPTPIRAAGLSPTALAQSIESAYRSAQIYTQPTITVISSSIDTVNKPQLTIGGQVRRPGPVEYIQGLTLYQALQAAGGATEFGSMRRVTLMRDGKVRTYDVNQNQFKNIAVQPNDTIEIPQKDLLGR